MINQVIKLISPKKLEVFETALADLQARNIPVIIHVILGLPRETTQMVLDTIHYLNKQIQNTKQLHYEQSSKFTFVLNRKIIHYKIR